MDVEKKTEVGSRRTEDGRRKAEVVSRRKQEVHSDITGWAQVNGSNAIGWEEKFKSDKSPWTVYNGGV